MLQVDTPDDYVLGPCSSSPAAIADRAATGETHPVREFVEKAFAIVGTQITWEGTAEEEVGKDAKSGRVLVRVGPSDPHSGPSDAARPSLLPPGVR